jgi:hypothetical protein
MECEVNEGRATTLREVMVFWCVCEEMLIVAGRRGPSGLLVRLWNKVLILGRWILRAKQGAVVEDGHDGGNFLVRDSHGWAMQNTGCGRSGGCFGVG